ncbi:hypothetical protein [Burkholderia sp. Ac-20365]|uniref:hypothetical protein n=1 Tax=Burkholderia sp. Ac-20365 TaxID=2703897 RepID=UPI00197B2AF2|nr:hypothetical protein [Burkholderia sp. Ac-20365]MBN3761098.1 hypothetical protein [Burkholderia sp. Ac-20365]
MKNIVILLALASLTQAAIAGVVAVVKDTRQYITYTASLDKDGNCTVAVDPDHPKQGDCHEVRATAPVRGEYVIRSKDWCQSDSFSQVESSAVLEGRPLPSIRTDHRTFRCDAQGNAV